jgi:hypothetical protein
MDRINAMLDRYGLTEIMIQNDIEEAVVLRYLVEEGMVELEDYFFEDVDELDEADD